MLRCILILLPVLFSTVLAKFYIEELKPSSGNVQDIKHYSYALNLLNNFISALESKMSKNEIPKQSEDQPVKTPSLESVEDPTRSLRPVRVHNEETQPSDLVPDKHFSPVVEEKIEFEHELVPIRTLRPVKVYSEETDTLNLEPSDIGSVKVEPLNMLPVRMRVPVMANGKEIQPSDADIDEASIEIEKIQSDLVLKSLHSGIDESKEVDQSDLVPTNMRSVNIESDEIQSSNEVKEIHLSNLVPNKLRSVKAENDEIQSSREVQEIHPSDLVPVSLYVAEKDNKINSPILLTSLGPNKDESEEITGTHADLVPVISLRYERPNKHTLSETNKDHFHICVSSCKRTIHRACRNYKCAEENKVKEECDRRCDVKF
ncbi:uncharacterized protein LOC121738020 [Aricia agestis]|uniref:uncharacterized protein LOC121738020 n=1 Tax=Aricia agestis TaxID=91739 RepID=UPI001C20BDEB|nr:uncharacterized protein LOC121738020 [Aricia agestis]